MIKKPFMTGLACLLPLVLTLWIAVWFINLITRPFDSIASTGVALLLLGGTIILVGFLAERLVVHYVFQFGHYLLKRIPVVGKIYKMVSDVINLVLAPKSQSFTEVVWVPFWEGRRVIGLVASEGEKDSGGKVSVFVPGAFNAAFGFVVLVERGSLEKCELNVEEALKYQVSCGAVGGVRMVDVESESESEYETVNASPK